MKRDDIVIIGVVGATMFVTAGCLAFGPECFFGALFGETTAAWVQAFGSIAAIYGVVWNSKQELRRANSEKREQRVRWAEAVSAVFSRAGDFVAEVCVCTRTEEQARGYIEFVYNVADVQEILDEFQAIRLEDLGSQRAIMAFYELRKALRRAKVNADSLFAAGDENLVSVEWDEYCEYLDTNLILCRQAQSELAETTALQIFSI